MERCDVCPKKLLKGHLSVSKTRKSIACYLEGRNERSQVPVYRHLIFCFFTSSVSGPIISPPSLDVTEEWRLSARWGARTCNFNQTSNPFVIPVTRGGSLIILYHAHKASLLTRYFCRAITHICGYQNVDSVSLNSLSNLAS